MYSYYFFMSVTFILFQEKGWDEFVYAYLCVGALN